MEIDFSDISNLDHSVNRDKNFLAQSNEIRNDYNNQTAGISIKDQGENPRKHSTNNIYQNSKFVRA